jgi:ABC-type antimicrobial peptide transport system, permease component
MTFNDSFFGNVTKRVIGVVKDSHNRSFKAQILPSVYIYDAGDKTISIKVKPGYMKETVKYLTNRLGQYYTKSQLEIKYLDDEIKASYKREYKVLDIFALFSLCAIIISCLGLYGVISFTTEIRSKEIGIRKVLGASVFQVVNVLFKEMAGLMLIAGIVAAPLGYYLMDKWLADFAYHININAAMFIGAVFVVYLIAVCSMVSQVIKASLKNPVETLKYE